MLPVYLFSEVGFGVFIVKVQEMYNKCIFQRVNEDQAN